MAITVTPKYKPFTYEELVKPLEGYWKDYDQQEQALDKALEDVSVLDGYLETLDPEAEGNKTYINQVTAYKDQIKALTDRLVSEGFDSSQRNDAAKLRQTYNSQIIPISNALTDLKKYISAEREKENAGYIIGKGSVRNLTLKDVIGENVPETSSIMSLKDLENEAAAITSNISSAMVDYYGATKSQIQSGKNEGYITQIGFDPKLLLSENFGNNQRVAETYAGIKNQIHKYVLSSLDMTPEEYEQLDSASKAKIDTYIKQGIIRGVQYQQSITPKQKKNTSSNDGIGQGRSSKLTFQALPTTFKPGVLAQMSAQINDYLAALQKEYGEDYAALSSVGNYTVPSNSTVENVLTALQNQKDTAGNPIPGIVQTDRSGYIPVKIAITDPENPHYETIYLDLDPEKKTDQESTTLFPANNGKISEVN